MMQQARLGIHSRILSAEETEIKQQLQDIHTKIRALRDRISERRIQLRKRRDRQQSCGLGMGEKPVTEELIEEVIRPIRKSIRLLERESIELQQQIPGVTKSSRKQTSLEL